MEKLNDNSPAAIMNLHRLLNYKLIALQMQELNTAGSQLHMIYQPEKKYLNPNGQTHQEIRAIHKWGNKA